MTTLRDQCQGKWRGILPALGMDSRFLSGKHGPCPICGGRDRFRFDDKDGRGTYICSGCGAGDGIALVMKSKGLDFKEAAQNIEAIVGSVPKELERRKDRSEKSLREAMNAVWSAGLPVDEMNAVGRYLRARAIKMREWPKSLRYVERCRHSAGGTHPAMVAKLTAPDGTPGQLHRTYLDFNGNKASGVECRMVMPGAIPKGSAVRLSAAAPIMGIAEGIETALSASVIWSMPVWAALNTSGVMAWEPPEGTVEVIVFADNDANFAGQQAAFALAHRLAVQRSIRVRVEMPDEPDTDWNDVLQADASPDEYSAPQNKGERAA